MVKIIPRGGIFVAEASIQKVKEVTEVRIVLEEYLGRRAAEHCSGLLLGEYENWLRELEPLWPRLTAREWMKKDSEFHRFMDRAGANQTLATHLTLLRQQAVLFWGQSHEGTSPVYDSLKNIIKDFKGALEAMQNRDPEACALVLRQHVNAHVERMQQHMKPNLLKIAG